MNPLYPLTLLVTFLHELSHALVALATGGEVLSLRINPDGSGLCYTAGGNELAVSAAGYLGSILLGNLLLSVGWKSSRFSPALVMILSFAMVFSSLVWFGGGISFAITLGMGLLIGFLAFKFGRFARGFLVVSGIYSVFYILRDYDVGPSSDLVAFARASFFNPHLWMWIWLAFAVVITLLNFYFLLRRR